MNTIRILLFLLLATAFTTYSQSIKESTYDKTLNFIPLFNSKMSEGVSCYRIPSLVTAPNGDLIAAMDERVSSCADLRGNRDINIVLRRSLDNGNTWTEMERIIDYPDGQSASDPSMIVDQETGVVFLFYNFMDLENEKNIYYLKFLRSSDNGKTWSSPVDITSQITKPEWRTDFMFITSGRGTQTNTGTLVHTLVNLAKGLHLFASEDHGENWYLIDTPIQPGDESKIVELADGSWMINSRVNNSGIRYVHISSDEGKTWTSRPDSTLIDPGCNASIIRYTSVKRGDDQNRLLFANAKTKKDRKNITIRISYDEGKSWSAGKTIYAGSSAYSSMTILENGGIGLFFEKDEYRENVFVQLTMEWLTDGKD